MKKLLIILLTITLSGCADGFNFETIATYQAEESNLKVDLIAKGFILYGHDLSEDGLVNGAITSSKLSDTIYFKTNERKLLALKFRTDTIEISNPFDITMSLTHCLNTIGHKYNEKELEELGEIIQLTAAGPKATYMEGQTKLIKVIRVDFKTD